MSDERDIGAEILEGIREIKAGKVGRVLKVPQTRPDGQRPATDEEPRCPK